MGPPPIGGVRFPGDNNPAEKISWNHIQDFESATGLGLPTEAQWEYACRAGTSGPYAGTGKLDDMGWHRGNIGGQTRPVGQKQPNQFGLYDMHGNVDEWCEDFYDARFYSKPEAAGPDPVFTASSGLRVSRGGNNIDMAQYCRSAYRHFSIPADRLNRVGFRPALPSP